MANFLNNSNNTLFINTVNTLLNTYEKVMILNLFVDSYDENLKHTYINAANSHNNKVIHLQEHIDAGFDLFAPGNQGDELIQYGSNIRFFGCVNRADGLTQCAA